MKKLIPSLPYKDNIIGMKFLEERNFFSLKELVDSALYKLKKKPKDDSLIEQIGVLEDLQITVNEYVMELGEDEFFNEFEDDNIEEEEFY